MNSEGDKKDRAPERGLQSVLEDLLRRIARGNEPRRKELKKENSRERKSKGGLREKGRRCAFHQRRDSLRTSADVCPARKVSVRKPYRGEKVKGEEDTKQE